MTESAGAANQAFPVSRAYSTFPISARFAASLKLGLRMTGIPYEVADTANPRQGPKGKVPFIEDAGQRIGDSSLIIEHLKKTRTVDPDAWLDERQRATSLLVQRTIEEHYAFVTLYTHFIRAEGWRETRVFFDRVTGLRAPAGDWPCFAGNMRSALRLQGTLRHSDEENHGLRHCRLGPAILTTMSEGPYFHGEQPATIDADAFRRVSDDRFSPVPSRRSATICGQQPKCMTYAERMMAKYFPEFAKVPRTGVMVEPGEPSSSHLFAARSAVLCGSRQTTSGLTDGIAALS